MHTQPEPFAPCCKVISWQRVLGTLLFHKLKAGEQLPGHAAKYEQLKADVESALGLKFEGFAFPKYPNPITGADWPGSKSP